MISSLLEISGPVMVGPSSSHTAGALKLGQFARAFLGERPKKVEIYLHGSFGTVYKGHATDRAIVAGLLSMAPSDENIKNSFEKAKEKKMEFKFIPCSLGIGFHPNTAKIVMHRNGDSFSVTGSSIGGGAIKITEINDFEVNIKDSMGSTFIIIIMHKDSKEGLNKLISSLSTKNNNIVSVHSVRIKKNGEAMTTIETDEKIPYETLKKIKEDNSHIHSIFETNI